MKKTYQAPSLTVHGDASQLTQATKIGTLIDRTFPVTTPVAEVILALPNSLINS